jgi:hypothetical protein
METLFKEDDSMFKGVSRFFLTIMLVVSGCVAANVLGQQSPAEPKPGKAVEELIKVFDRFPLVALGEVHRSQTEHDLIISLIKHPDFVNKVNDIVVEFGNAKYQPIMDRYLAGEVVARTELRQVWRNTTQPTMILDAPVYERFFTTVRAVNQNLPKQKQVRVLLGDPPIDWDAIKTKSDFRPTMFDREGHFVSVVEKEVLGKRRKALLISGAAHLIRCCLSDVQGVTAAVEKLHPGVVFVVMPHQGFGERNEELEKRLASWPNPGLALVNNTWLGALSPGVGFPVSNSIMILLPDGGRVPASSKFKGMKFQDMTDAYLYLGPKDSVIIDDTIPPEVLQDEEYQRELQRRQQLRGGNQMRAPRQP